MANNAGFNKPEPFLEASEAIWHKIIDVNALGVLIGIQEAAKAMIAAGTKGKIINTPSIAGRTATPTSLPIAPANSLSLRSRTPARERLPPSPSMPLLRE
jgi:meso-butanediol dehydrogenase / (S,S)-butanediol dehydrogenase / diacetyl reductase